MKGRLFACILVLFSTYVLSADPVWEGSAAVSRFGEFPGAGYFGASNSFPKNTVVEVKNLESGKTVKITITKRLDDPGLFLLVSHDAAKALGIMQDDVARVRVGLSSDIVRSGSPLPDDLPYHPDPDINPAAQTGISSGLTKEKPSVPQTEAPQAVVQGGQEKTPEAKTTEPEKAVTQSETNPVDKAIAAVSGRKPQKQVFSAPRKDEAVKSLPRVETPAEETPEVRLAEAQVAAGSAPQAPETPSLSEVPEASASQGEEAPAVELPVVVVVTDEKGSPLPVVTEEYTPPRFSEPDQELPLAVYDVTPDERPQFTEEPAISPAEGEIAIDEHITPEVPEAAQKPVPDIAEAAPGPVPPGNVELSLVPSEPRPPVAQIPEASLSMEKTTEPPVGISGVHVPEAAPVTSPSEEALPSVSDSLASAEEIGHEITAGPEAPQAEAKPEGKVAETPKEQTKPEEAKIPEAPKGQVQEKPTEKIPPAVVQTPVEKPVEKKPPEVKPAEKVPPIAAAKSVEKPAETPALKEELPIVTKLDRGTYYIQVGAYSSQQGAGGLAKTLSDTYPVSVLASVVQDKTIYKVLVGPLNQDEGGTLLYWFKAKGYKDVFLRKAN